MKSLLSFATAALLFPLLPAGATDTPPMVMPAVAERIQAASGQPATAQAEPSFGPRMLPPLESAILSGLERGLQNPSIKNDFPNLVHTVIVQRIVIGIETDHVALSKDGILTIRTQGTPEALKGLPKLIAGTLERVAALHAKREHAKS